MEHPIPPAADDGGVRQRAGIVSLVVAVLLLCAKFQAWLMTGSSAVLSDALESIVNVVAAAFAVGGLAFAVKPADRNHPYGHGKIEFFAAAFEGGLIAFAALLILWEVAVSLVEGVELHQLDAGIAIVGAAGAANFALGRYLLHVGRKHHSLTLIADGQHVLADFWTSVGLVVGLLLVRFTGLSWLDPAIAGLVALHLLVTGSKLVRTAASGLLDEEDPVLLQRLVTVLGAQVGDGVISVHRLRAIRAGRYHHVSGHLVVPEFWTVEQGHAAAERVAAATIARIGVEGDLDFHTDPCERAYCERCDVAECPVRASGFVSRVPLTVDEAVQPDGMPA